jgi:arsenate reductase
VSDGERWRDDVGALRAAQSIAFICVANSARSQLGEAIARHLAPPTTRIHSAGSEPTRVRPMALQVLEEAGIPCADLASKGLDAIPLDECDVVVTLCAEERCPVLPSTVKRIDWALPDPAAAGDEKAELEAFRATLAELRQRLQLVWRPAR